MGGKKKSGIYITQLICKSSNVLNAVKLNWAYIAEHIERSYERERAYICA